MLALIVHCFLLTGKIKLFRMEAGQLTNDYERQYVKNKNRGSGFIGFLIILFCLADGLNYYSSFNTIYTEDMLVLLVLSATLAIILNYSNTVIVKFLTSSEEVDKNKKRILWIGTFLMLMVIASILVMLYMLRFSIMDILFDGVSLNAAKSMTLIWSTIAVGTTVASFGFSCVNNLIIIPSCEKLMKRLYNRLAKYLLQKKESVRDEIVKKLELYAEKRDDLKRTHEHNIELIKSEAELLYQMSNANLGASLTAKEDETEKFTPFKKAV